MKVLYNHEVDNNSWISLVRNSKFATPFQTPEFYNFINSISGFSADVFAVSNDNILTCLAVVTVQKEKGVKSFFSKRGILYGGPIVSDKRADCVENLLSAINNFYRHSLIYLEVRNNNDFNSFHEVFRGKGYRFVNHLNVQLRVANRTVDDVLKTMKYNRRREIKMSFNEGASVRLANSYNEVEKLFDILRDLYTNKVKLPLPPLEYFTKLYDLSQGRVFVTIHKNEIIGGAFCMEYSDVSINTLYYAGLRDYHKKIFPTHLAIIGTIKYAIDHNIGLVDFMGAGKPNQKYGVRDFKLQFGGDLVDHGRFLLVTKPVIYVLGMWGLKILSKIK